MIDIKKSMMITRIVLFNNKANKAIGYKITDMNIPDIRLLNNERQKLLMLVNNTGLPTSLLTDVANKKKGETNKDTIIQWLQSKK